VVVRVAVFAFGNGLLRVHLRELVTEFQEPGEALRMVE
jgi:hypothetical protein